MLPIKIIFLLVGLLIAVIPICVFGLDWKLMADILYRASFSIDEYNKSISYSSINIAIIAINFILLILVLTANIGFVVYSIFNFGETNINFIFILTGIFILFSIPIESITYKFFSCFSIYQVSFVRARSTLMIIYALGMLGYSISFFYNIRKKHKIEVICFLIGFLLFVSAVITICSLNIALLVNLSQSFRDINPDTVKMGIFTADEIEQIKNGKFVKDSTFEHRILGTVNDLIKSEDKILNSVECSGNDCDSLFKRFYRKEINCSQVRPSDVFIDCKHAYNISKVFFKFQYTDSDGYPVYNCGKLSQNNDCSQNCEISNSYNVYLIQEFSNQIELGWNAFGRCDVLQPKIDLKIDKQVQVECSTRSNSFRPIQSLSFVCLFLIIWCFFLFKK